MDVDRRSILAASAAAPLAPGLSFAPDDWDAVRRQYDVTREVVQLEHGNWGMMARPVMAAYQANLARVNRDTSFYARRAMVGDLDRVRSKLAEVVGVDAAEIALTRNATEALKALILQYNRLKPGDAVLYADLDYDAMQGAMRSLARRRGARLITIALPEPATRQALTDAYEAAFAANPAIRMALLTHVSHRTGLVLPVADIAQRARARGIDVIVDAAHSVGPLDFRLSDLQADFIGFNLHKWIGAPLGVAALYIRKEHLGAIDPDPAEDPDAAGTAARVHTGTPDYAAQLTLPAALRFQNTIGAAAREARLKALRDRWVRPLRSVPGVQILTPDEPALYGAITSFRLRGRTSHDDNVVLARTLLDRHGIFTVHRDGLASGSCVRVTPSLATAMADLDRLVSAIRALAA